MLLPVSVLSPVFGAVKLRNLNTPIPSRIDAWSLLFAATAFGGLIYGLSSIGEGHAVIPPWIPLLGRGHHARSIYHQAGIPSEKEC